jgi:hypothetical protein
MAVAGLTALMPCNRAAGDEVRLKSGDVLKGKIAEQSETTVVLVHPLLGRLSLPRTQIEMVTLSAPDAPASEAAAPVIVPAPQANPTAAVTTAPPTAPPTTPPPNPDAPATLPIAELPPKPFWEGWRGSVDAGINGSDGNSETFSARTTLGAKRVTTSLETSATLQYIYVTDDGIKSKSRGEVNLRNDWLLNPSPWGFFALGKVEYDEFQPWDLRGSAFVGPSYTFIQSTRTTLRGRTGLGITREFGSERNEVSPEALFGLELNHKLSDRSRLFGSTEILPSLADFPEHRINSQAGYELLVDPQMRLNIKFGVASRYNSDPGERDNGVRFKSNDIEYFITAGWDF